nr:MAG TPA: hypothetical protein [Caudoviricetes sp.]
MIRLATKCEYAESCFECPFPDVPSWCLSKFDASEYADGIEIFRRQYTIQPFPRDKLDEHVEICAVRSSADGILRLSLFYDKFVMAWIDIGQRSPYSKTNVLFSVGLEKSLFRKQAYVLVQGCYKYCYGVGNLMARAIDCTNGKVIARKAKGEISKNEFYAICDSLKSKKGYTFV